MIARQPVAAIALSLLALQADAQPVPTAPYVGEFSACLQSRASEQCRGRAAQACMDREEGGHTTIGMSECLAMEGQLWSIEIDRELLRATQTLRAQDAENRDAFGEAFAGAAGALAASQATWAAWADAECGLVYAEAGAGSIRTIAAGHCTLDLAVERLQRLRQIGTEAP
ncbi:MAG: lysozyme inhibitor LprI family protein [Pseudomonadota bacterium]